MIDIAIITARSGSQGLPNKNILKLGQTPLIGWTIRAACASNIFKKVIVTTDCKKIADISQQYGAEVPFLRPKELATSSSGSIEVVKHALNEVNVQGEFALLQPTSPFRSAHHLITAYEQYQSSPMVSLISVSKGKPASWIFKTNHTGYLSAVTPETLPVTQRQNEKHTVTPNGGLYFTNTDFLNQYSSFFTDKTAGYEMNFIDSIDIDYQSDFDLAQAIVLSGLRAMD